jgi:hypothetical protein
MGGWPRKGMDSPGPRPTTVASHLRLEGAVPMSMLCTRTTSMPATAVERRARQEGVELCRRRVHSAANSRRRRRRWVLRRGDGREIATTLPP